VIGAGGLGSSALMYMAAAGVGHIGIVDADTVDESNLQRQIIHGTSTIDVPKCESAAERLRDINPYIHIRTYQEEFTSSSALRILNDGFSPTHSYDLVIDGSDNFPTKYLIDDACTITGLPWVYSAILAFEGQISVFNYGSDGPNYRDMIPTPPPPGDVPSCAEGGVLGVLPGTMGCLQATEALKILMGNVGVDGLLVGRILAYDALAMKFSEVGLKKREKKDRDVITELIDYQGFCAGPKGDAGGGGGGKVEKTGKKGGRTMDEAEETSSSLSSSGPSFRSLTPKETIQKLSKGWAPYVLDVRLQTENDIVELPFTDAVVPHREVRPHQIPKHGDVLVYCKAGVRGKKACNTLVELGVDSDRLYNLDGGIMGWQKQVDTSMPRY